MKKTMRFLSMTALALVGAVMTGCSGDDDSIINNPQQPMNSNNSAILKTTISFDDGATTRALTIDDVNHKGVKTFAVGDQIAIFFKDGKGRTFKALSNALNSVDIKDEGKTASITVDFLTQTGTTPAADGAVRYIYPANMAKATIATDADINDVNTIDFTKLNNQDGTLTTLGSDFDLCTFDGNFDAGALPTGTLTNQLAILAITLKHNATSSPGEINNTITGLTVSDGTNIYTVSRSAVAAPIYVAIHPTDDADIDVTATDGTNNYVKYLTSKTYEKNNGYNVSWLMTIPGKFTVGESAGIPKRVEFATSNLQATYDGSSWSWAFAANPWDRIGDAAGNTNITDNGVSGNNVTVDLFGWVGASSSFNGAAQYGITNSTIAYGNKDTEALKYDWGTTIGGGWRTPTKDEWTYVFSTRKSGSIVKGELNARYTHAIINTDATSVNGMILFPDGVKIASNEATTWGTINGTSAWGTKCTSAEWTALAAKGCVFLPVAGYRNESSVLNVNVGGYYWSSSAKPDDAGKAYTMYFKSGTLGTANPDGRKYGLSVRLVKDE